MKRNDEITAHSIAVIGMNKLEKDVVSYEVPTEALINDNPNAVVVDLWTQEIYPLTYLKTKIQSLQQQEALDLKHPNLSRIEIAFHIPKTSQLSSELKKFYPKAYEACEKIASLISKRPLQASQLGLFAHRDPYTRPDGHIGWCEPPKGSRRDNEMTIVAGEMRKIC